MVSVVQASHFLGDLVDASGQIRMAVGDHCSGLLGMIDDDVMRSPPIGEAFHFGHSMPRFNISIDNANYRLHQPFDRIEEVTGHSVLSCQGEHREEEAPNGRQGEEP